MSQLTVENYRGLRDVTIPMSRFGCLIGENNSGKSSFLQALSLFYSGAALTSSHLFDPYIPVRIAITFSDIGENDLRVLVEEHRTRIQGILRDGEVTLVRVYNPEGKSRLHYRRQMPTEARFSSDEVEKLLKGSRPGPTLTSKVTGTFPELSGQVDATMDRDAMRDRIQALADAFPDEKKRTVDVVLPTGLDESITPLLPEVIYIPGVKDLSDDIKTTQTTPFGKILGILLHAVEPKLPEAAKLFGDLDAKLNRVTLPDGTVQDGRLEEVRTIESTVENYVQQSFSNVTLKITIPPPELRSVFSSAKIYANDGVEGLIETKGDGLRRAIVFAILRSYVALKGMQPTPDGGPDEPAPEPVPTRYLLLFEEPELFLYPKGQQILFDALQVFAEDHHVMVTTHSPMFFGPQATGTFIKLTKAENRDVAPKPFTMAYAVDLGDMRAKDQFQIICYENNNAAFFADTVVLVEGDSDYLVLPHIAKTLNPQWDTAKTSVRFARVHGKGSIGRYKEFFSRFNTRVVIIADLDILVSGLDQVAPDQETRAARQRLITVVDEVIAATVPPSEPSGEEIRDAQGSGALKALWRRARRVQQDAQAGRATQDDLNRAVEAFFDWERHRSRLHVMKNCSVLDVIRAKESLLGELRRKEVFVLSRGTIEDYYPDGITGIDKPSRAQDFCRTITTREAALELCDDLVTDGSGARAKEFELIFRAIFESV